MNLERRGSIVSLLALGQLFIMQEEPKDDSKANVDHQTHGMECV
jgi:hypothetical protein